MNKKADMSMQTIAIAILVLLVVIVVSVLLYQGSSPASKEVSSYARQLSISSCERKGISGTAFDNDFGKGKGDGFPDSCDVCLGGDDRNDYDADYIPDACDDEPKKPAKKANLKEICENAGGIWKKDTKQCELKCYKTGNCPVK